MARHRKWRYAPKGPASWLFSLGMILVWLAILAMAYVAVKWTASETDRLLTVGAAGISMVGISYAIYRLGR